MEDILVYLSFIHKGNWEKIYSDITNKEKIDKEKVSKVIKEINSNYITILNPNYPECLKYIFKPPFVLYYKGNIDLLLNKNYTRIAVIGSRNNSKYGEFCTKKICEDLTANDSIVIVSGLAKGIDSIAHKTSLINNGKTIAIIGNGLNIVYPKENLHLYDEIGEKGLILSEYPLDVLPDSSNFPNRNRIIAGISQGVVVTEAKIKSGTMNTVSHALENGKQIFCVPDKFNNNSGCNKLIKEGAKLIENGNDIIEDL